MTIFINFRARSARALILAGAASLLTACIAPVASVKAELKELTRNARPEIPALPAPSVYEPADYQAQALSDPFAIANVLQARSLMPNGPDMSREKGALEHYDLGEVRMVGVLRTEAARVAIVSVNNVLHPVKLGQHIGQNYGVVTAITDTAVTLKETIQHADGTWVKRTATLSLQAQPEAKK